MIFIGVDPGLQGAIALISDDDVHIFPMPINGDRYDLERLCKGYQFGVANLVVVEQSQPFPGQGVRSCYTIGYGFGLIEMALVANEARYQTVHPATWKKTMLAGIRPGDKKAMSIQAAKRLFPGVNLKRTERSRVDDHNYAEALLIGDYAKRNYAAARRASEES